MAVFFSVAGFFHRYYLSMLAPGIAVLAGVGVVLCGVTIARQAGWRGWLLPFALVATAITQAIILQDYADYSRWMTPLSLVGSFVVAGVLVWQRVQRERLERRVGTGRLRLTPVPPIRRDARIVEPPRRCRRSARGCHPRGPRRGV